MRLSLIKCYGGKGLLYNWVISHFPKNYQQLTYVEPCLGGGSVLLNKLPSIKEVGNDIDANIFMLWIEVQLGVSWLQTITLTPYERSVFEVGANIFTYIGEREFILRNMSRGGMKKHFSWSDRERGGQPEGINLWENKISNLPKIRNRIKDVEFCNLSVIDCLRKFNDKNTLTYIDPPYLLSTRTAKQVYDHEMTEQEHSDLLDFLLSEYQGSVILSGYNSTLYNDKLKHWNKVERNVKNNAGQTKKKSNRIEVLWMNY